MYLGCIKHIKPAVNTWADEFKLSDVNPREWKVGSLSLNKQLSEIAKGAFHKTLQGMQFVKVFDRYQSTMWSVQSVNVHKDTNETFILLQHVVHAEGMIARPVQDLST